MSSSVVTTDDDFVPGRKLVVHVAENGHTFEFDCEASTMVEAVQRSVESLCGVPLGDQLLLCLDKKLEPNRPLSFYKLPQDDRDVFLYNRPRLHTDSPPPDPEVIEVAAVAEPSPPSPGRNPHPLDEATDPALKALPSYEREFRHHFQRGRAVYNSSQAKLETCRRLAREQRVQVRALETARGSMDQGYRVVQQNYTEFIRRYTQQHRYHSDLLANFGKDIERLRLCQLHPALQTDTRKCLLDLVKEEHLRKWAENCANSHRQFEAKVAQLKSLFGELKKRVEDLCSDKAAAGIKDLEAAIKDHEKYVTEQKSIMQSLSKDINTVKKLMDDCLSCQLSASLRPHDAVSALGPMYDIHEKNHLPKMEGCDCSVVKLLDICKFKKNDMNLFVHQFMQKVVFVQSIIRDIRLQFPAFKEAMERQDDYFADLKLVRGIAPAYRACFAEIIRRKSSMKLYMGLAGQLAERLATEREAEVNKREEFLKAQSVYLPQDILASMGLYDSPKPCDVNIAPFDTNLLEIDFSDLDRYAPKHLAGVPPRRDKTPLPKGSMATSVDSYELPDAEVNSGVSTEKCESELLEGCDSVHIAGTSKLEVENAWLKAELASAVALICSFSPEIGYDSTDDSKLDSLLRSTAEKTAEALQLKDEYINHLQNTLKMKQMQCSSYEKRIQELEQGLADQYLRGQQINAEKDASESALFKGETWKPESSTSGERQMPYLSTEPMDEASSTSTSLDPKVTMFSGPLVKPQEGIDENMADLSGTLNLQAAEHGHISMDSSMLEPHRDEHLVDDKVGEERMTTDIRLESTEREGSTSLVPCEASVSDSTKKARDELILEMQTALTEKLNQFDETEALLKVATDEVSSLRRELEISRKLLDESQMNCAHLENCLHEAREEARTNLCAAERRVSEYNALRASAVKLHGLFERFRSCVTSSAGINNFAESLRSLALSLSSSTAEDEDSRSADFRTSIKVLADKVALLSRHRADLQDRCSRFEVAHGSLLKDIEEKKELIKTLYAKLQLEKQACKDKLSFSHLEVHELAAFVRNPRGHYEAINRSCSNYYLSAESVALFTEHLPVRPTYVVGQVVHIEKQVTRFSSRGEQQQRPIQLDLLSSDFGNRPPSRDQGSSSLSNNPYDLPFGCEYFIVTVAMLPDTIHSPAS